MSYCAICQSLMINGECSNRHCNKPCREWVVDGVLVRFKEPVTKEEAEIKGKARSDYLKLKAQQRPDEDDFRGVSTMRDSRIYKKSGIVI
jgi:hypothetical protein